MSELHRHRAVARQVVGDARQLTEHHAVHLAALRNLDAKQLLDCERKADVVQHRRDVVESIDVREHLPPGAALTALLEAAMQIARLDVDRLHDLAVEIEDHLDRPVHRRMRRAHVEPHRLRGKLERSLVLILFDRLHD
jgi:hypothetical protein